VLYVPQIPEKGKREVPGVLGAEHASLSQTCGEALPWRRCFRVVDLLCSQDVFKEQNDSSDHEVP